MPNIHMLVFHSMADDGELPKTRQFLDINLEQSSKLSVQELNDGSIHWKSD